MSQLFIYEGFYLYKGKGNRLDGKEDEDLKPEPPAHVRGIIDYDFNIFELKFDRNVRPEESLKADKEQNPSKTFKGDGRSLRGEKE